MSKGKMLYDVIIVGGGISGLYTARCLVKEGLKVMVCEARDHVGGRTLTQRDSSRYDYVDLGGAYVGSQQTKLLGVVKELGLEVYNIPTQGKSVLCFKGERILYTEENLPIKYLLSMVDMNNAMRTIDDMSKQVPLLDPWNAPRAMEWDAMSVADLLKKICWTRMAYSVIKLAMDTVDLVSQCDDGSLLNFLHDVRLSGGVRALFGTSEGGLQEMKIKGGSNSVSERLAEELTDVLKMNCPVISIDQTDTDVVITTEDGNQHCCRQVVLAVSPPVLKYIDIKPRLPEEHQAYINYKPTNSRLFKTVMYYEKSYWLDKGLRGEFASVDGIATYGLADTKWDGSHPAIMSFLHGDKWGCMTETERKNHLSDYYAQVFNIPEMKQPIDYVEKDWGDEDSDKYSGICVYTLPAGFLTKHRVWWGESCDRIHFAGTEASVIMHGYMDGGLMAAEAAASKVLKALNKKPSLTYDTVPKDIQYLPNKLIETWLPGVPGFIVTAGAVLAAVLAYGVHVSGVYT